MIKREEAEKRYVVDLGAGGAKNVRAWRAKRGSLS